MTKPRNPISWDECFMQMAYLMAMRSKDPSTQAGAVIVDQNKVIVGLGYNGFPRGIDEGQLPWSRTGGFTESKYAFVVHAERMPSTMLIRMCIVFYIAHFSRVMSVPKH